jgi:hypothetical protein
MVQLEDYELVGDTGVLGKKLTPVPIYPPQIPHDCLESNPGRSGGMLQTNRLIYGMAIIREISAGVVANTGLENRD